MPAPRDIYDDRTRQNMPARILGNPLIGRTAVATALTILLAARSEAAGPTLREALKNLAKDVAAVVKAENQTTIAVGDFVGPADLDANSGPGIADTLKSLLEEIQPGLVQRKTFLSLRGHYDKIPDPKDPATLVLIRITAEITNKNAERIDEKFTEIRDSRLLTSLIGATVSLPPEASPPVANQLIQQAIERPKFVVDGTKNRATAESPFAIEILVTSKDSAPRDATGWHSVPARSARTVNGEPFVDIDRNEVYAIRIHNDLRENGNAREAATYVTIDGLDVFTFSEIRDPKTNIPKYSYYVMPPGKSLVTGWHKTNDRVDSFLVTEFGKGAASSQPTLAHGKIGVITVQFPCCTQSAGVNPIPKPRWPQRDRVWLISQGGADRGRSLRWGDPRGHQRSLFAVTESFGHDDL